MSLWNLAWNWNATSDEEKETFPCDKYMTSEYRGLIRALDVSAPANIVFRWICQLKIAPYSYDWLDNGGHQSPRQLIPGVEQLELGQNFMIGGIVEFEEGRQITCLIHPKLESILGSTSRKKDVEDLNRAGEIIVKGIYLPSIGDDEAKHIEKRSKKGAA